MDCQSKTISKEIPSVIIPPPPLTTYTAQDGARGDGVSGGGAPEVMELWKTS